MTCWAYKDGVLASDTLVATSQGYILGHMDKCKKLDNGWIAAAAGRASDGIAFFDWVEDGRDPDSAVKLGELEGIMVSPKGVVFRVEEDLKPYQIRGPFFAGGSGAEHAMAAMEMGASPEEAVRVAMKYNIGVGGDVISVRL